MADELTPEEIEAAAQAEAEEREKIFNEELVKRFGTTELIKKSEQTLVLTEEQKKEAEEKKQSEILKFGLDKGYISAKEHEEYIAATTTPKKEIARKKFIEKHPELGEKASEKFDKLYKQTEDDEIEEGEGENVKFIPNEDKKLASSVLDEIADNEINAKFSRVKSLPKRYEEHLEQEAIKTKNTEIITKSIAAIPKRYETEVEGIKVGIDFSDDDFKAAYELTQSEVLKKDLKAEDVTGAAASFLFAKNAARLLAEGIKLAYAKGRDDEKRGAKGLIETDKNKTVPIGGKRGYLQKEGMIT